MKLERGHCGLINTKFYQIWVGLPCVTWDHDQIALVYLGFLKGKFDCDPLGQNAGIIGRSTVYCISHLVTIYCVRVTMSFEIVFIAYFKTVILAILEYFFKGRELLVEFWGGRFEEIPPHSILEFSPIYYNNADG